MSITLHVKDKTGIVKTATFDPSSKEQVLIDAKSGVNYQLVDNDTTFAPENIVVIRRFDNLLLSVNDDIEHPDITIKDYFSQDGKNLLVGRHENGKYYPYVPESGRYTDVVTHLIAGKPAGQALGDAKMIMKEPPLTFHPYWFVVPVAALTALAGYFALKNKFDKDDDDGSNNRIKKGTTYLTPTSVDDDDVASENDDVIEKDTFATGELRTLAGNDQVIIDKAFGAHDLSALIDLGQGDDEIALGVFYNSGIGERLIDGGDGVDTLTLTQNNVGEYNLLLIANIEVVNIAAVHSELNIDSSHLFGDTIDTLFINNSGSDNVIDLGNNNQSANDPVDTGGFTRVASAVKATDSNGESHWYDVYTVTQGGVTETLYIDTSFTVI